jgi:hypothetical protein
LGTIPIFLKYESICPGTSSNTSIASRSGPAILNCENGTCAGRHSGVLSPQLTHSAGNPPIAEPSSFTHTHERARA